MGIEIAGIGSYLPERILTNADLEKIVDTNDEWITTRTGIKERRIAKDGEATSDLAIRAAERALKKAKLKTSDIDAVIVATITPDMFFPSTACFVQKGLGMNSAAVFDISAACSGFIYGLGIARDFLRCGTYKNILLIGAETLSRITDWKDRGTCVLLGDGAGAVILRNSNSDSDILSVYLGADGNSSGLLFMPGGGSRNPATAKTVEDRLHYLKMEGNKLFKVAVRAMADSALKAIDMAGISPNDVTLVIPHQANIRIVEGVAKLMNITLDRVYINIQKYGNTSAATTPIALEEAIYEGKIKKGDIAVLVAFGGGLTWGAAVIKI
ncbi:MAG: 3-oxoacyl-(acyl-carrier-protein) synthase 3 [Elusimicrobia bacterium ADurb.Bin231]|nr:MAG: 3-oxoacyl-(acyl-carrier-protein) synthase 3 [Elusimicrobia bacterium ADurb.Bin231]